METKLSSIRISVRVLSLIVFVPAVLGVMTVGSHSGGLSMAKIF